MKGCICHSIIIQADKRNKGTTVGRVGNLSNQKDQIASNQDGEDK